MTIAAPNKIGVTEPSLESINADRLRRGKLPKSQIERDMKEIQKDANTFSRLEEEFCISGTALASIPLSILHNSNSKDADISISATSSFIGTIFGVGVAALWYRFRNTTLLKNTKELLNTQPEFSNPWARRFKTAFFVGQKVGELFGYALFSWMGVGGFNLVQNAMVKICGAIFALAFGFGGILFFDSTHREKGHEYPFTHFGRDGWTKYAKTGFVFGNSLGILIGCLVCLAAFPLTSLPLILMLSSAIGSLSGFAVISAGVPLYHWYKLRKKNSSTTRPLTDSISHHNKKKSEYRTNYIRAGIVVGGFIGSITAGILALCFAPPLLIPILITIGGAIGTLLLGIIFGVYGPSIGKKIEDGVQPANSFDYAIRTGAMFGNNYGLGQTFSKTPGIFGMLATSIFGLIASTGAVIREILHAKKLKADVQPEIKKIEKLDLPPDIKEKALDKAKNERRSFNFILPWTQRAAPGILVGYAVMGYIGFLINPLCFVVLAGIGGILGGILACYAESYLRQKKLANNKTYIPSEPIKVSTDLINTITAKNKLIPNQKPPTEPPSVKKAASSTKLASIKSKLAPIIANNCSTMFAQGKASLKNKTPLLFQKAASLSKRTFTSIS